MKSSGKTVAIVGCILIVILTLCCSTSAVMYLFLRDRGDSHDSPKFDMQLGEITQSTNKEIGAEGGNVLVSDESDELYGAKIQISDNSLDEDEEITIGYRSATDINIPEDLKLIGDAIVLTKTSDRMFQHPVSVTIPYDTTLTTIGEAIGVYEYDEETGTIQATTIVEHDSENGTIEFLTSHFSIFIIIELEKTWNEIMALDYDTGFSPKDNGWFIKNWGSYITDNGSCLGMSAVAQYLYSHQSLIDQKFYEVWREGDKNDQKDDKISNELAARVQLSLADRWNSLSKDLNRFDDDDQPDPSSLAGQAILMNFLVTEEPQVMYVMTYWKQYDTDGNWKWATANHHAILTYKYENGRFAIYDPNYPYRAGSSDWEKDVTYTWENGFGVYSPTGAGGYNYVRHIGPNLVNKSDIIAKLIGKAKAGFPDDEFPDITFDSPEEDEVITEKSVVVSGSISGIGYLLDADETYMHWYFQNEKGGLDHLRTAVDFGEGSPELGGSFEQELPLQPGENTINVLAAGKDPTDEWAGWASTTVNATMKPSDMVVTLSWDRGQSDIDLHVTDPEGNHVWYSNMSASTGAELDFDNTSGFGPEHYTISAEEGDEMPVGNYKIDVVYYADHDSDYENTQAVPWTINARWVKMIIPNTEEKIWESITTSGVLTSDGQKTNAYTINYTEPVLEDFDIVANPFGVK